MKINNYFGIDDDVLIIEQPTDVYPVLDWLQSRMIENEESVKGSKNKDKFAKASNFLSELMDLAEQRGFGSHEDIP